MVILMDKDCQKKEVAQVLAVLTRHQFQPGSSPWPRGPF